MQLHNSKIIVECCYKFIAIVGICLLLSSTYTPESPLIISFGIVIWCFVLLSVMNNGLKSFD